MEGVAGGEANSGRQFAPKTEPQKNQKENPNTTQTNKNPHKKKKKKKKKKKGKTQHTKKPREKE